MIEVEVKLPVTDLDEIKSALKNSGLKRNALLKNMIHTLTISREI